MKPYIISHMMESVIACNITFDFLSVCSVHARLREKIPQALRARMIFSTNPKGLALLVREEHGLPLPVVMGTRLRYVSSFPYMFL